jgi:hypothetical protein
MAGLGRFGPLLAMTAAPALLATIAASYTAFWFYHASQVKAFVADWATARRAEGHTVAYTLDGTGGFPLSLEIDLKTVRVDLRRGADETWSLHAPELTVRGGVFSPRSLTIDLPKGAQLGLTRPDAVGRLIHSEGSARLDLTIDGNGRFGSAALSLKAARFSGSWKGADFATPLAIGEARGTFVLAPPTSPPAEVSARLDLMARDLRWPANLAYSLGQNLEILDLSAKASGPIARGGEAFDALDRWRGAGGQVTIERLALRWGAASLAGYGTLSMDEALQPAASLCGAGRRLRPLVDVLEEANLIRPADATLARLVIGRQIPRQRRGQPDPVPARRRGDGRASDPGAGAPARLAATGEKAADRTPHQIRRALLQPGVEIGPGGAVDRMGNPVR